MVDVIANGTGGSTASSDLSSYVQLAAVVVGILAALVTISSVYRSFLVERNRREAIVADLKKEAMRVGSPVESREQSEDAHRHIGASEDSEQPSEQQGKEYEKEPDHQVEEAVREGEKQHILLELYHGQGLSQSRVSFWFSLIFAAVGFLVIISAIIRVNSGESLSSQSQVILPIIAGAIIDAVSALFFVQSNRARQLMTEFFDKLREDRKFDESIRLVKEVSDDRLRGRLQASLALNFANVPAGDSTLGVILDGFPAERDGAGGNPPDRSESKNDLGAEDQLGRMANGLTGPRAAAGGGRPQGRA